MRLSMLASSDGAEPTDIVHPGAQGQRAGAIQRGNVGSAKVVPSIVWIQGRTSIIASIHSRRS